MSRRRKGHSRRGRSLRRRYGHFGLTDVKDAAGNLRAMARDNPEVTAAALGASAGALAAGMGTGTAALVGAAAGIAVEQAVRR